LFIARIIQVHSVGKNVAGGTRNNLLGSVCECNSRTAVVKRKDRDFEYLSVRGLNMSRALVWRILPNVWFPTFSLFWIRTGYRACCTEVDEILFETNSME